jgi:tetratricopeptide (TPR) repeat protein
MTYYHPIWAPPKPDELQKGSEAIQKAAVTGKPTEREKAYVDALSLFYKDSATVGHMKRAKAYAEAMHQLAQKYPDDTEATIFYALALRGTAPPDDKTYAVQKEAAAILNGVLKKEPNHPGIAHYLIHSYDYPALAELALPAARIYSKIASSSPHALHMPSHIFTRLGLWQESIDSNRASEASAIEHVRQLHPGAGSFDQLHAMDYLVYAYLQTGQDEQAKKVMDEGNTIQKLDQNQFAAAYAFAAIPARYAIERNQWADAAKVQPAPEWFPWKEFPYAEAITYFTRGIGAARSGNLDSAREDLQRLQQLHQATIEANDPSYDWGTQVQIQQKTVDAWITFAEKKTDEALQKMRAAADLEDSTDKHAVTPGAIIPARELYADMLMELKRPADALPQYEKSLAVAPNRFHAMLGVAKAADASGDKKKAKEYYSKLLKQCIEPCSRPEVSEAKAIMAEK